MKKAYHDFLAWLAARLVERSTWLGLTAILSGFGVAIAPEYLDKIIAVGIAVGGLIGALTKDK